MKAPFRIATALLAASLLASCGGGGSTQASNFTPVPVTPAIGDVPQGDPNAPVTFVEYAALTCHVCRDFAKQIYPRLKREYIDTGKVKYIYRDFPLEADVANKATDGFGVVLAAVSRCKGPEKHHELVDALFTAQADLLDAAREGQALPVITRVAEQHGMSVDEMRTCIDAQPELINAIKKSRDDASAKGVSGTPALFINDEQIENRGWDYLKLVIEAKLAGQPTPKPSDMTPAAESTQATPATPAEGAPADAAPAETTPADAATPPAQ
jgi:protein-disulfide isomerase